MPVASAAADESARPAPQVIRVPVGSEPDGSAVDLDASLYSPGAGRHPAILLAHGFGGSKADLDEEARQYAASGYVVLAYTARGFGASGGRIHLDDPAYEVADARELLDLLAARSDVTLDSSGDPRVAVVGASYGGALALMTAAADRRVDTVVAAITWNDLYDAFFPNAASVGAATTTEPGPEPGPFKQLWASRFFAGAIAGPATPGPSAAATAGPGPPGPSAAGTADPLCGRFDPTVCHLFLTAAETGSPSPALRELLRSHSPAPTLSNVHVPVFLVQGLADTLFGLDQADATARELSTHGIPVAVRWTDGGHDAPSSTAEADAAAVRDWLAGYLGPGASAGSRLPVSPFGYAGQQPRRATAAPLFAADTYPGVAPTATAPTLRLHPVGTTPGRVVSPPGGQPASVTGIPGTSQVPGAAAYPLAALPLQFQAFDTDPLGSRLSVVGSPRIRLRITSTARDAIVFVSWWVVTGESATLPRRLVAPVRIVTTPGVPIDVDVALPAATYTLEAGSVWRLVVTSTDNGYANPRDARLYSVTLAGDGSVALPVMSGMPVRVGEPVDRESQLAGGALALVLLALLVSALIRRRRAADADGALTGRRPLPDNRVSDNREPGEPGQPGEVAGSSSSLSLHVDGLVKTYADGHRAVDGVTWSAAPGQIVGLLGANGAGKTTTMRMMVGLIAPTAGRTVILGETVVPGAPVLARVGALIEGPGFLPHLTGRANLRAYWAATGRAMEEAGFEDVLEVAALGDAIDRPVRSYSHGMRQRLGIAQAMLGAPDILLLDEPTNGLDPPQIAAMRSILTAYAAPGRTVIVSSHLLAEVEMTCTHVVVMDRGRVVMHGPVADLRGDRHLEEVVLGAIAAQRFDGTDDRLRQVRAR